jgi:hypothetical protein
LPGACWSFQTSQSAIACTSAVSSKPRITRRRRRRRRRRRSVVVVVVVEPYVWKYVCALSVCIFTFKST